MNHSPLPHPDSLLRRREEQIEAFEVARARTADLDLAAFLPTPEDPLYSELLAELIRVDLDWGHEQGAPRSLSGYLERFPCLRANPERLQVLAFEEYRLRRTRGENPQPGEYEQRYGVQTEHWPAPHEEDSQTAPSMQDVARSYRLFRRQQDHDPSIELGDWLERQPGSRAEGRVFAELHQSDRQEADRLARGLSELPQIGVDFLGFELLSELGRGAFGRVYLARQPGLANRLVALKVAPDVGGESQTLAQMQHTHIVPIYSVHRAGNLQAVCMPYFGALTLADVLRDLSNRPSLPQAGTELLTSLQRKQGSSKKPGGSGLRPPLPDMPDSKEEVVPGVPLATLKRLRGFNYVEAVLWLASCLAEGLAHAHERGIIHRDLKPANVLLTDDGQPMLLDFNLAEDVKARATASGALIGGTLPYMAPEHLQAFRGEKSEVDERSDLFSLGVILYELLTGRYPYITRTMPLELQLLEPGKAMDRLVDQMYQERSIPPPALRLFNRAVTPAVSSILQRCLHPDPQQRYRSALELHEDLECHLDGLPLKHAPDNSVLERVRKRVKRSPRMLGRLAAATALVLLLVALGFGYRSRQLTQAEDARVAWTECQQEVRSAQWLLNARLDDPEARAEGILQAEQALARYRVLENAQWQRHPLIVTLPLEDQEALTGAIGELLLYLARAHGDDPPHALALLARAEECFTPEKIPAALFARRAEWLRRVHQEEQARHWDERAAQTPPRTALDYSLRARDLAHVGRYKDGLAELDAALLREPRNYWANFLRGICFDGQAQPSQSAGVYTTCIALAPEFYGAWFNRGVARLQLREFDLAVQDFDQVLRLRPELADAYLNRGLARLELGAYEAAGADFTEALKRKPGETRLYFLRSRARSAAKDAVGARADFDAGLQQPPGNDKSWISRGLARASLPGATAGDFTQAIADFDAALQFNPNSREALVNKISILSEKLHRPAEALPLQDRLIERYPEVASYRSGRGVVRARLGLSEAAHDDARAAWQRDRSPASLYQIACIHALLARSPCADAICELCLLGGLVPELSAAANSIDAVRRWQEQRVALDLLRAAVKAGYGADYLETDTDLATLRALPEFQQLLQAVRLLRTR